MPTVGIVDIGTPFETDTIVAGSIEVGRSIEIVDLFWQDACDGVVVHLGEYVRILLTTADACGGDEMGVDSKSLREEHLITGTYHTAIVQVDIIHEEPGADTVVREFTTFLGQLHDILVKEQSHLVFRVGGKIVCRGIEEMSECPVTCFVETTLVELRLDTRHQTNPQGHLRTVEWRLLDDAFGTEREIGSNDLISLIGSVAEEVTLKDGLRVGKP